MPEEQFGSFTPNFFVHPCLVSVLKWVLMLFNEKHAGWGINKGSCGSIISITLVIKSKTKSKDHPHCHSNVSCVIFIHKLSFYQFFITGGLWCFFSFLVLLLSSLHIPLPVRNPLFQKRKRGCHRLPCRLVNGGPGRSFWLYSTWKGGARERSAFARGTRLDMPWSPTFGGDSSLKHLHS